MHFPPKFLQKRFPLLFSMMHLLHRLYGVDARVADARKARTTTAVRPRYNQSTTRVTTGLLNCGVSKLCGRPPQYAATPCKLTFDLLTLKVVSESHVTWPTSVPILVLMCVMHASAVYVK